MAEVEAIFYEQLSVGKRLKGSKHRHTWHLVVNGTELSIILLLSKLSKKRVLYINNIESFSCKKSSKSPYLFVFSFAGQNLKVIEDRKEIDLLINSISFKKIYSGEEIRERSRSMFVESVKISTDDEDWEQLAVPYKNPKNPGYIEREIPNIQPFSKL